MSAVWIYVTASDAAEAEKLGRMVVEARLAACANVLGPMTSIYWWDGEVQADPEVAMVLKSRADLVPEITDVIIAAHSYDCPCIVALPISDGNPEFLSWIEEQTRP